MGETSSRLWERNLELIHRTTSTHRTPASDVLLRTFIETVYRAFFDFSTEVLVF